MFNNVTSKIIIILMLLILFTELLCMTSEILWPIIMAYFTNGPIIVWWRMHSFKTSMSKRNRILYLQFLSEIWLELNMYRSYSSILLTLLVVVVFNLSLGLSIFSLEPVGCKLGDCDNGYCLNSTCICDKGWTGSRCQFCDGRFR